MKLAIDIGNTTITAGIFRGRKLIRRASILTCSLRQEGFVRALSGPYRIDRVIVCSVVPSVTALLEQRIRKVLKIAPLVTGRQIMVPIRNRYRRPREVGQDRLVNAFAGARFYGAPAIIIDFGTAVTFDVVSAKKEYLGGLILPGLKLSLDGLAENTALLPRVELRRPREFIGRDTQNSITSGIVYGVAAASDELVRRIKAEVGGKAVVIATGGDAAMIAPFCRQLKRVDRDLTLKGLNALADSCEQ